MRFEGRPRTAVLIPQFFGRYEKELPEGALMKPPRGSAYPFGGIFDFLPGKPPESNKKG